MKLTKPGSPAQWQEVLKKTKAAEADEFGIQDVGEFEAFRAQVGRATSMRPLLIGSLFGCMPAIALILTQNVLHKVKWGGIPWGLAALSVVAAQLIAAKWVSSARNEAILLGDMLGIWE